MNDMRPTNVPEYTVSELAGRVRTTLEGTFGRVRVRGEITELKRHSSGHVYLCLKDAGAKLGGVIWRSSMARVSLSLENGLEVVATGRLSTYPDRSSYQLVIDRMEYAGIGALLARIERLRQRLAAEGLFDAFHKRPLPILPTVIGVVTSTTGAVIQDIRTTIARRFPRLVLVWPVPVQGEGAALRIAAAIRAFDALPIGGAVPRPEVVIIARGGGSLEDLMPFNEEVVVRAAAACRIPLISAVGHETDTTLIDYVADRRAPTPTAAAELAIAPRADLVADLQHKSARLLGGLTRMLQERRLALSRAERGLPDLPGFLGTARQRLDDRSERLTLAMQNLLLTRRGALARAGHRLADLPRMIAGCRERLADRGLRLRLALPGLLAARRAALGLAGARLAAGLRHAVSARHAAAHRVLARLTQAPLRAVLREARAHLRGAIARLESVSPEGVLQRGYALVFDNAGRPVTEAASVRPAQLLKLRFAEGEVRTRAAGRTADLQGCLPLDSPTPSSQASRDHLGGGLAELGDRQNLL
ncbi:MAG: exodeoxyribonuclease VII large subunit [Acetobacteraceae bacterium]|nr:exodeoxyribonuclease VII large subunit [Acetobacteraceae bacterium]